VARLHPRLAAGVGVLSVFLLLGGLGAAAAIADDGDSGSHRDSTSDRDGTYSRGGSEGDGSGVDGGTGEIRGGDFGERDSFESPRVRVGSGRGDTQELLPGGSGAGGRSDAGERFGSGHSGSSRSGFDPPRVTVGNGRSPGILSDDPEPRWRAPAPEAAPPPPPPPPPPVVAPPPPSLVKKLVSPPATPKLTGARSGLAPDALFGLAGLVLIPAAGAYLGYRQAKGARAATETLGPSGNP
jgi:hypothetical protein